MILLSNIFFKIFDEKITTLNHQTDFQSSTLSFVGATDRSQGRFPLGDGGGDKFDDIFWRNFTEEKFHDFFQWGHKRGMFWNGIPLSVVVRFI